LRQQTAALQNFNAAYVHFGSKAAKLIEPMRRLTSRFAPKADITADLSESPLCAISRQYAVQQNPLA
jgi:hypothetical protein